MLGSATTRMLRGDGHEVVRLVRRAATSDDEISWDPSAALDPGALGPVDAAINLCGAGVGDHRWNARYKQVLRDSRVLPTATLAEALALLPDPPSVLLNASAIGFYGDTAGTAVDETAPRGRGFLADLCAEWEAATDPAESAGIRVVHLRTGLVVSGSGGAWGRLLPLFKAGLGGPMGSGDQFWSTISLSDQMAGVRHCLNTPQLAGPVNVTGPHPLTNREMAQAMGTVLHRPAVLPAPGFALKAVLGEFAGEILGSQRVLPTRLLTSGFVFSHPRFADQLIAEIPR
jgi:hypothetical protein